SRFSPFATTETTEQALEVEIQTAEVLPQCDGEKIYEPDHAGIDIITSRASRLADGSLVMEFKHIHQNHRRLWMRMSPRKDRARIVMVPEDDANDPYFLTHALMIAFMLATTGNGSLMVHAATVIYDGKAYMFQGRSGTGKSTHAALWTANIPGAELLNDDNPIIRFSADGTAMVYGSPWSGKTHCYRNVGAPIGAMVRIVRSQTNELRQLDDLRAYASLTTTVSFLPFLSKEERDVRHQTIERLVGAVECCEMHCRPDADAALTCMASLTK
ncbi:MAG: hypothetical protein K2M65_05420, partial [Muribaculaceae bacterium]|nr:hypothetical protein [Muribaculaceae bacterium]